MEVLPLIAAAALALLHLLTSLSRAPALNAYSVFSCVWVPLLFLDGIFHIINPVLSAGTVTIILTGGGALAVGVWFGGNTSRSRFTRQQSIAPVTLDVSRIVRIHWILLISLVGFIVLQLAVDWPLISSVGGFHALFDQSSMAAYNLRVEQVGQLHRDGFTAESALIGALGYLLFMGNASVFTGALLWRNNMRWLAILPLLFNGIYSLLSFQRSSFIAALLIQAFATIGMMKLNVEFTARAAPKPHRRPRPLLVAGLLTSGFAVLLIPIQLRNANTQNATGVQSIAQYLFSSIAGLNARTDAVTGAVVPPLDALGLPGAVPGFGAYTFTNLFGLFQRFGLPVATPPFTYDYDQVVILGRSFSTNTATSFYELILDAGWFGLIIGCLVVGIACTRWQMQMSSQTRIVLLPWVSLLLSVVAWSFFVNLFTRDARYMLVAAFGSLVLSGLFHYRRPSLAVENRTGRPFGERESHGQASKTPRSA